MGEILADGSVTPSWRQVDVAVARADETLSMTISWEGPPDDAQLSLMWGDRSVDAFARGADLEVSRRRWAGKVGSGSPSCNSFSHKPISACSCRRAGR